MSETPDKEVIADPVEAVPVADGDDAPADDAPAADTVEEKAEAEAPEDDEASEEVAYIGKRSISSKKKKIAIGVSLGLVAILGLGLGLGLGLKDRNKIETSSLSDTENLGLSDTENLGTRIVPIEPPESIDPDVDDECEEKRRLEGGDVTATGGRKLSGGKPGDAIQGKPRDIVQRRRRQAKMAKCKASKTERGPGEGKGDVNDGRGDDEGPEQPDEGTYFPGYLSMSVDNVLLPEVLEEGAQEVEASYEPVTKVGYADRKRKVARNLRV